MILPMMCALPLPAHMAHAGFRTFHLTLLHKSIQLPMVTFTMVYLDIINNLSRSNHNLREGLKNPDASLDTLIVTKWEFRDQIHETNQFFRLPMFTYYFQSLLSMVFTFSMLTGGVADPIHCILHVSSSLAYFLMYLHLSKRCTLLESICYEVEKHVL